MDKKEIEKLENMTLGDIHAGLVQLQTGSLSYEDWHTTMLAWAKAYLEEKAAKEKRAKSNIARQKDTEEKSMDA